MAHSIPDSRAVVLRTELGALLITGDYKFDQTPVDGRPADVSRLAELGREGVLCLCGDSTNADRPGVAPSESSVGPALLDLFSRCRGRIIVTSFASNVHRVQQVIDAAAAARSPRGAGRSLDAQELQHRLEPRHRSGFRKGMLIPAREIESFPDHEVVAISTGSQGEPLSALRRMAHADHADVELHSGDTVIFSATPIPGNERSVNETIDRIFEIGAEVVTAADAPIHASGHGWQEELKLMLNLTRPRYVMPVHGDHKRLRLHAALAESVRIDPDRIFKGRNGLTLEFDESGARLGREIPAGMIFVDGVDIGDPDDVALRDRRALSADGVFIVVATISSDRRVAGGAPGDHLPRGAVRRGGRRPGRGVARRRRGSLTEAARHEEREATLLQQDLHDDIAAFVYERLRRRPMVLPVIVEV